MLTDELIKSLHTKLNGVYAGITWSRGKNEDSIFLLWNGQVVDKAASGNGAKSLVYRYLEDMQPALLLELLKEVKELRLLESRINWALGMGELCKAPKASGLTQPKSQTEQLKLDGNGQPKRPAEQPKAVPTHGMRYSEEEVMRLVDDVLMPCKKTPDGKKSNRILECNLAKVICCLVEHELPNRKTGEQVNGISKLLSIRRIAQLTELSYSTAYRCFMILSELKLVVTGSLGKKLVVKHFSQQFDELMAKVAQNKNGAVGCAGYEG